TRPQAHAFYPSIEPRSLTCRTRAGRRPRRTASKARAATAAPATTTSAPPSSSRRARSTRPRRRPGAPWTPTRPPSSRRQRPRARPATSTASASRSDARLTAARRGRGHQHGAGELAGDVGMHADADDLARLADQRAFDVIVVAAQLKLGEGDVQGTGGHRLIVSAERQAAARHLGGGAVEAGGERIELGGIGG